MKYPAVEEFIQCLQSAGKTMTTQTFADEVCDIARSSNAETLNRIADAFTDLARKGDVSQSLGVEWIGSVAPDSPIADITGKIAIAYGARAARLTIQGTSQCNIVAGFALKADIIRNTPDRSLVLVDRGGHMSAIGAMALPEHDVRWMERRYNSEHGVQIPLQANDIESQIVASEHQGRRVKAVFLVSPSYEGISAKIENIVSVCKKHNVEVWIDGAWGALWGLHPRFPPSPVSMGASLATVSLHKKGLGTSQCAALLFNSGRLLTAYDQVRQLGLETTSPYHPSIVHVESCLRRTLSGAGLEDWNRACEAAEELIAHVDSIPGCYALRRQHVGTDLHSDPCHLTFNVRHTGHTGYAILNELRKKHGLICEMATRDTVLMLAGPDLPRCLGKWKSGWSDVVMRLPDGKPQEELSVPQIKPDLCLPLHEALRAPQEVVASEDAIGRISAIPLGAYPPGQCILFPGERVNEEAIEFLRAVVKAGGRLKGISGSIDKAGIPVVK